MGIAEKTVKNKVEKIKKANVNVYFTITDHYTIKIILDQMIEPQMRPRIGRFNIYDPLEKYKKIFKEKVINELNNQNITIPMDEDKYIESNIILISEPPKSFTKKKLLNALLNLIKFNKKPDIDNCVKTIYDSFEKVIFFNDSQIVKETFEKTYGTKDYTIITFDIYDQPDINGRLTKKELEEINDEIIKNYIKEN